MECAIFTGCSQKTFRGLINLMDGLFEHRPKQSLINDVEGFSNRNHFLGSEFDCSFLDEGDKVP